VKRVALYALGAALLIAVLFFGGRAVTSRFACQTEERLKLDDPSGLIGFEVEYASCDSFAVDEGISVYASKVLPKGAGLFSRWRNRRTLLFRYDPGRPDNPLPSISRPSQSMILISVPEVSSSIYQSSGWAGLSIKYDIGRVYYPSSPK